MSNQIPNWNEIGILPPINQFDPTGFARSPYKTNIVELVKTYTLNQQRGKILSGFLDFRELIYNTGITDGFQWIDGSFTEDVELTESRTPNDIDVVTFFNTPDGETQHSILSRNMMLFMPTADAAEWRKKNFQVDSYWQSIQVSPNSIIEMTVYWYSMWSHKRDLSWKGFLQIPLSRQSDVEAKVLLNEIISGGFNE